MYEDIEVKGGIWRYSHWRLWQEKTSHEAYGARRLRSFVVLFLLYWVIGTTVLLSGVQENQSEWLKWCLTKTYVFKWRLWERSLSRVGQVSFACGPSKVVVWVWNLSIGTHVSSLVTQGHFGQIRSGCLVVTPQIYFPYLYPTLAVSGAKLYLFLGFGSLSPCVVFFFVHLLSCHLVHRICIHVHLMRSSIFPVVCFAFRRSHVLRCPFLPQIGRAHVWTPVTN